MPSMVGIIPKAIRYINHLRPCLTDSISEATVVEKTMEKVDISNRIRLGIIGMLPLSNDKIALFRKNRYQTRERKR
jgi:hypothetical protein